jgi:T6SS immunity protein Tdi1, C-terminal
MSLKDYLIEHGDFDWDRLFSGWEWFLPAEFTVWLMNRYGDLFLILPDGSVHMLDVGIGSLTKMAQSKDEFCQKIDQGNNANDWLMIPLVDRLTAAGIQLQPGQCYSLLIPPVLGGDYTIENTVVLPIFEHFGVYGSYHEQLRDVPDGTSVVIKVNKPSDSQ